MGSDTRARIIEATTALFMQRGLSASGLKQIAADSGATIGSLYHFFPGGKDELAAETLRASGASYQALVEGVFDAEPDLVSGVRACFEGAADALEAMDYADACPVATVALEVASSDDALRAVSATIFEHWFRAASARIEAAGVPSDRAREVAMFLVAALEGGFLLSRTAQDTTAMRAIGRLVTAAVEVELAQTARA